MIQTGIAGLAIMAYKAVVVGLREGYQSGESVGVLEGERKCNSNKWVGELWVTGEDLGGEVGDNWMV